MVCGYRNRKRFLLRLGIDAICIALVACVMISIKFGAEPYHRGFFCDDQSIQHPYLHDTVTVPVAVVVGLLVPSALIIIVEALFKKERRFTIFTQSGLFVHRKSWQKSCYDYITVFLYGQAVTQLLTEIGKYSIGRLRPHFLTLCAPDFSMIDCSKGYITVDVCTNTDADKLKESRLSFPSGHSSFAMYSMFYAILYVQTRFSCKRAPFLKPCLELVLFCLGFFTCLSRISDYKHHWSDVLAGALLGMGVCLCMVRGLTDFGKLLFVPRMVTSNELEEVLTSSPSTHGSMSSHGRTQTQELEDQRKNINNEINL